jgi:putative peptidoglycan lipid II flippase
VNTHPEQPTVLRPRTITPGSPPPSPGVNGPVVVRPRTIGALGRPDPIRASAPPLEAFADPAWQPPTGQVAAIEESRFDPELWDDGVPGPEPTDGPAPGQPVTMATEATGEPPELLRNNLLVASGTALSRLTGVVRTGLIVALLGTTIKTAAGKKLPDLADGYILANTTPNIIYELILGGVLTATLVPLFTDDLENGDGSATNAVVSVVVVVLLVLTALTALLSPGLMYLYSLGAAKDFRDQFRTTGVRLALLFAPQVFFYGLMALWSAVLNSRHRFFAAAWAPILNNVVVIGVLVSLYRLTGRTPTVQDLIDRPKLLLLLGLGTTAGIALMAISLLPALARAGTRLRFRFQLRHPAVRRTIRLSAWTFGYVIANQIAVVVVSVLAKPSSGGVTNYTTAFQFFQLPHGLLAVSIMVTFEPLLGRADARGDRVEFNAKLLQGFRLIGLLVIPAAVGYIALPTSLDATLVGGGHGVAKALQIGGIVAAFAIGLPGFSSYLYALRGFYAMKDTRTPFYVNCMENAINIVAAIVLVRLFGVVGLALAYSLAYSVSAVVAIRLLTRRSPGFDQKGLATSWAKLAVAGVAMGVLVYGLVRVVGPTGLVSAGLTVGVAIVVGAIAYFGAVYALGVPGIGDAMGRLPVLKRFAPR